MPNCNNTPGLTCKFFRIADPSFAWNNTAKLFPSSGTWGDIVLVMTVNLARVASMFSFTAARLADVRANIRS